MAEINSLSFSTNIIANALNERNPFEAVYDISGKYNTFSRIVDFLNVSGPVKVESDKYEKAVLGNLNVAAEISAGAGTGVSKVVTLADASYDAFRVGDIVMDNNRVQGRVSASSAGSVTIDAWSVTAFVAADFGSGTIRRIGDASAIDSSTGKSALTYTPTTDYNYTQVMRNSAYLSRRDISLKTYVRYNGQYWWLAQEELAVKDLARQREFTTIFGTRQRKGGVDTNGGLIWSIDNRGGTHIVGSSQMTRDDFHDYLYTMLAKNAGRSRELTLFYGLEALKTIQDFSQDVLINTGINNTLGSKDVLGFDVQTYGYLGTKINFVPLPILDDPKVFGNEISTITGKPRMSSSFFLVDTTPIDGVGAGPQPAIESIYRGEKEMYYGYIPGMIGPDGGSPSSYMAMGKSLMANDIDGVSCHMLTDSGINIVDAKNMLFFEYAY
jgi:hypothetical protein